MSVIYCVPCDRLVDTDFDVEHCYSTNCPGCPCNSVHWHNYYTLAEAAEMRGDLDDPRPT